MAEWLSTGVLIFNLRATCGRGVEVSGAFTPGGFDCVAATASDLRREACGKELLEVAEISFEIGEAEEIAGVNGKGCGVCSAIG